MIYIYNMLAKLRGSGSSSQTMPNTLELWSCVVKLAFWFVSWDLLTLCSKLREIRMLQSSVPWTGLRSTSPLRRAHSRLFSIISLSCHNAMVTGILSHMAKTIAHLSVVCMNELKSKFLGPFLLFLQIFFVNPSTCKFVRFLFLLSFHNLHLNSFKRAMLQQ